MKKIKCHKCGKVHSLTGFYGRSIGQKCRTDLYVDIRKGSGGYVKCQAKLRAEDVFTVAS
jgi:hypothetical protein